MLINMQNNLKNKLNASKINSPGDSGSPLKKSEEEKINKKRLSKT